MKSLSLLALALTGASLLSAQECWLQPSTFFPTLGRRVHLAIQVGAGFRGEPQPFSPALVERLRQSSLHGGEDFTQIIDGGLEFPFYFAELGTHVITYDSKPNLITLEPDKFAEYLRQEGLDDVLAERERTGESTKPGRERDQRHNKAIVHVDGTHDRGCSLLVGQRLEFSLLDDPVAWRPGGTLRLKLMFEGQPLAEAKVRAWHRAGDKLTTLDARTTAEGDVAFALPDAGEWMLSTVHLARVTGDANADWESHRANLTFAVSNGPTP